MLQNKPGSLLLGKFTGLRVIWKWFRTLGMICHNCSVNATMSIQKFKLNHSPLLVCSSLTCSLFSNNTVHWSIIYVTSPLMFFKSIVHVHQSNPLARICHEANSCLIFFYWRREMQFLVKVVPAPCKGHIWRQNLSFTAQVARKWELFETITICQPHSKTPGWVWKEILTLHCHLISNCCICWKTHSSMSRRTVNGEFGPSKWGCSEILCRT